MIRYDPPCVKKHKGSIIRDLTEDLGYCAWIHAVLQNTGKNAIQTPNVWILLLFDALVSRLIKKNVRSKRYLATFTTMGGWDGMIQHPWIHTSSDSQ